MTDAQTLDQDDTLHLAVRRNDLVSVQMFIDAGVSPDDAPEGVSAIFVASTYGSPEMIDLLVANGANPNFEMTLPTGEIERDSIRRSLFLRTALNGAAFKGRLRSVERLLAHGADPRVPDHEDRTPGIILMGRTNDDFLDGASIETFCDLVESMLAQGMPVNAQDNAGRSMLFRACTDGIPLTVLDLLFRNGADPNIRTARGWTPLHSACWHDHALHVSALIAHGANVNLCREDGKTALHMVRDEAVFEALMTARPYLDAQDQDGRTPLAEVLTRFDEWPWPEKAAKLIAAGADPDVAGKDEVTPRELIQHRDIKALVPLLAASDARRVMQRAAGAARRPAAA